MNAYFMGLAERSVGVGQVARPRASQPAEVMWSEQLPSPVSEPDARVKPAISGLFNAPTLFVAPSGEKEIQDVLTADAAAATSESAIERASPLETPRPVGEQFSQVKESTRLRSERGDSTAELIVAAEGEEVDLLQSTDFAAVDPQVQFRRELAEARQIVKSASGLAVGRVMSAPEPKIVRVSIGRLEIRTPPAKRVPEPSPRREARPAQKLTIDEYLERKKGEAR